MGNASEALSRRPLSGGAVQPTLLGFGGAPIGNLYAEVGDEEARDAIDAALACGIRYFDTAPYYGYGLSEERLGRALYGRPRESLVISTKVGRVLHDDGCTSSRGKAFAVVGREAQFDYSRAGILSSFESSLRRLRTDYIDILLLHDIGELTHGERHPAVLKQALDEALPAMAELRAAGACRAIGVGVNEQTVCLELLPRFPLDCFMLAGRYTLLEQANGIAVLEAAARACVAIIIAAPFNSGLLSDVRGPGPTYNYRPVDAETLAKARGLYELCAEHGVDIGAAALQFPLMHPAVVSVVAGMRSESEVRSAARRLTTGVPEAFWSRLIRHGLLDGAAALQ